MFSTSMKLLDRASTNVFLIMLALTPMLLVAAGASIN